MTRHIDPITTEYFADWDEQSARTIRKYARHAFGERAGARLRQILGASDECSDDELEIVDEIQHRIADRCLKADTVIPGLCTANSITEILAMIFRRLLNLFTAVRYYHFTGSGAERRMVSVASVGNSEQTANAMLAGEIVRYQTNSQLGQSESFWCHELKIPVLFQVRESARPTLRPLIHRGCVPVLETPIDHCESVLKDDKTGAWIDFPVVIEGRVVGKLSCDLSDDGSRELTLDSAIHIAAVITNAAPSLEVFRRVLNEEHRPGLFSDILSNLERCQTFQELCEYCVTSLVQDVCNAKFASIFTVSVDDNTPPSRLLVLQKTNYGRLRPKEQRGRYDLDVEEGLTVWVASEKRALRLHNLDSECPRFQAQLAAYKNENGRIPRWLDRHTDSNSNSSFLAVPIILGADQVIGVIRVTEKCDGGQFTEADQERLQAIAKIGIGPRFVQILNHNTEETLKSVSDRINGIITSFASFSDNEFRNTFREILDGLFPQTVARKLFLCNIFASDDRRTFRHWVIGGKLAEPGMRDGIYESYGSLSAFAEKVGHAVFINHMKKAEANGILLPICEGPICALAAPIKHRDKIYGVVVVKSEEYDIHPERDRSRIEFVAQQMGLALWLRDDHN